MSTRRRSCGRTRARRVLQPVPHEFPFQQPCHSRHIPERAAPGDYHRRRGPLGRHVHQVVAQRFLPAQVVLQLRPCRDAETTPMRAIAHGTPEPNTTRRPPPVEVYSLVGQSSALPPSHTITMRSLISGFLTVPTRRCEGAMRPRTAGPSAVLAIARATSPGRRPTPPACARRHVDISPYTRSRSVLTTHQRQHVQNLAVAFDHAVPGPSTLL